MIRAATPGGQEKFVKQFTVGAAPLVSSVGDRTVAGKPVVDEAEGGVGVRGFPACLLKKQP